MSFTLTAQKYKNRLKWTKMDGSGPNGPSWTTWNKVNQINRIGTNRNKVAWIGSIGTE